MPFPGVIGFVEPANPHPDVIELAQLTMDPTGESVEIALLKWRTSLARAERVPLPGIPGGGGAWVHQVSMGRLGGGSLVVATGSRGWDGGGPVMVGVVEPAKTVVEYRPVCEDGAAPTVASDGELVALAWTELVKDGHVIHVATFRAGHEGWLGKYLFLPDPKVLSLDFRAVGLAVANGTVYVAEHEPGYVMVGAFSERMVPLQRAYRHALSGSTSVAPIGLLRPFSDGLLLSTSSVVVALSYDLQASRAVSFPSDANEVAPEVEVRSDGGWITSTGYCASPRATSFARCFDPALFLDPGREFCPEVFDRREVKRLGTDLFFLSRCAHDAPNLPDRAQLVVLR